MRVLLVVSLILLCASCGSEVKKETDNSLDAEGFNKYGSKAKTSTLFPYWDKFGFRIGRGKFRAGYMNLKGERVIQHQFLGAFPFTEGLGCVQVKVGREILYGYIDKTGDFVIEPQFAHARPFKNGRAWVASHHHNYGVIDTKGNLVTDTIYNTRSSDFMNGYAIGFIPAGTVEPSRLDQAITRTVTLGLLKAQPTHYYDVYRIALNGDVEYIETTSKFHAKDSVEIHNCNGLGRYWERDANGKELHGYVQIESEDITQFRSNFKDHGPVVIKAQFKSAEEFMNGYARVKLNNGKQAYINTKGDVVFTYKDERGY